MSPTPTPGMSSSVARLVRKNLVPQPAEVRGRLIA
jgi:hypothetical protein